MVKIVLSSGHGLYVRGASGIIDEVDEARKVTDMVAKYLKDLGVETVVYHDDVSQSQSENLDRIVDFHNSQGSHDLDLSVHFNAFVCSDRQHSSREGLRRGGSRATNSQDDGGESLFLRKVLSVRWPK